MQANDIIQEISYLYELSLSVGQSLDAKENCKGFIKTLMARKNLEFGAVWIKNQFIPYKKETEGFSLMYAHPIVRLNGTHLDESECLKKLLSNDRGYSNVANDSLCKCVGFMSRKQGGAITLFKLEKIGFLVIYSSIDEQVMSDIELNKLRNVIQKFAISLKGCLYHEKSVQDLITLTKTQQELERAKEKAEESDKLKACFLANMSHEIRTPVNSILGFANLLSSSDITHSQQNTFINHIYDNSKNLLHLISDIIDFSKLETQQLELNNEKHYLNPIMYEVYQGFEQKHIEQKKSFTFRINLPKGSDNIKIQTDRNRLHQILNNLLSNAFKFTSEGFVELGYFFSRKEVPVFYVKDSGIGISANKHQEIFKRFHQIENSSTRKYGGAGLGLALNKKLVKLMGGEICLESEENKGSCFFFSFEKMPVATPFNPSETSPCKQKNKEEVANPFFNFKDKTILIAEDVRSNYHYLNAIIELTEASIIWAKNGEEAVAVCKDINNSIDLVLMDIRMPVLNGLEAIRQIKAENRTIPIIVQTAFAMNKEKEQSFEAGADEFIAKPINPQKLLDLLKKHL